MSAKKVQSFRVVNQRDQPVELHALGRVVVIPPVAKCEVSRAFAEAPQIKALAARRLVTLERVVPDITEGGAAPPRRPPRGKRGARGHK